MFLLHLHLYGSKIVVAQQCMFQSISQIKSHDKSDLAIAFYTCEILIIYHIYLHLKIINSCE